MNNKDKAAKEITDALKKLCDALHKTALTNQKLYMAVLSHCLASLTIQEVSFLGQMKIVSLLSDELHNFESKKQHQKMNKGVVEKLKEFFHRKQNGMDKRQD